MSYRAIYVASGPGLSARAAHFRSPHSVFAGLRILPTDERMRSHEWHRQDEEAGERRYFRAAKFGTRWSVQTTLKSEPDWHRLDPIPLPILEELRTQLLNKYQRRRVPYEYVTAIDRMVCDAGGKSAIAELSP